MAIAATDADLDFLKAERRWQANTPVPGAVPWSDDFSNIFRAIRRRRRAGGLPIATLTR